MNNARLWTIVSPNTGVPIFFIALFLTSVFVHYQVMANTSWFADFVKGTMGS